MSSIWTLRVSRLCPMKYRKLGKLIFVSFFFFSFLLSILETMQAPITTRTNVHHQLIIVTMALAITSVSRIATLAVIIYRNVQAVLHILAITHQWQIIIKTHHHHRTHRRARRILPPQLTTTAASVAAAATITRIATVVTRHHRPQTAVHPYQFPAAIITIVFIRTTAPMAKFHHHVHRILHLRLAYPHRHQIYILPAVNILMLHHQIHCHGRQPIGHRPVIFYWRPQPIRLLHSTCSKCQC